jgi:hypothetical protein
VVLGEAVGSGGFEDKGVSGDTQVELTDGTLLKLDLNFMVTQADLFFGFGNNTHQFFGFEAVVGIGCAPQLHANGIFAAFDTTAVDEVFVEHADLSEVKMRRNFGSVFQFEDDILQMWQE